MGLSVLVFVVILTFYAARWLSGVNRKLIEECQRDGLPHPRNLPSSVRLGIGQKLAALMLATGLPFTAWLMWILARDPDLEYVPPLVIGAVLFATITLGAILGVIGAVRIALWQKLGLYDYGEHWGLIALTVAAALVGIVTFGSLSGSMLPFILKRLGFDPASASAPFVATLVDVTGLVIYFGVAALILRGTLL